MPGVFRTSPYFNVQVLERPFRFSASHVTWIDDCANIMIIADNFTLHEQTLKEGDWCFQ